MHDPGTSLSVRGMNIDLEARSLLLAVLVGPLGLHAAQ
jgi:hypothetical protein